MEAVYHLTSHGKVRQKRFFSDANLELFLDCLLGQFDKHRGKLRRNGIENFRDGLDKRPREKLKEQIYLAAKSLSSSVGPAKH